MIEKNIQLAEAYYNAVINKDKIYLNKCLAPNVHFLSPFMELSDKESLLKAVENFGKTFNSLKFRTKFGSDTQAMLVYDLDCPAPIGLVRAAALFTIDNELITNIELFFDSKPFESLRAQNQGSSK